MSTGLFDSAEQRWRKDISNFGGIITGEFFISLKQGNRIANTYINLDVMYPHVDFIDRIGREFNSRRDGHVTVVAAPAVGAIPLAFATARAMQSDRPDIKVVWADKQKDGTFAFERMTFAKHVYKADVLVVEDIGTSGGSAKAVIDLVMQHQGCVTGAHFVWARGKITADGLGVPYTHAIINEKIPDWAPEEHPNWGKWPLATDVGHPEYFPDYRGPTIKLLT